MGRLIDELISLSRIEADRFSLPETPHPLGPIARQVVGELRAAIEARKLRVDIDIDEGLAVPGDHEQLLQLIRNLVDNAVKYGRPDSAIAIGAHAEGPRVALSVRDEGEGIAAEHLPRLTERFYRADPGRSRALGGTGLGLAIVKHIVERHRGRLDIASRPGEGTVVTVHLPPAVTEESHGCGRAGEEDGAARGAPQGGHR